MLWTKGIVILAALAALVLIAALALYVVFRFASFK